MLRTYVAFQNENTVFPYCGCLVKSLDWTGRCVRADKRWAIDGHIPPILTRLNIEPKNWFYSTQNFESSFKNFAGTVENIKTKLHQLGYRRCPRPKAAIA